MAETATDSAPNGTKLDDVKVDEPVKEVVIAAETGDKATGDLKPVSIKGVLEKVAEASPGDSSIKAVAASPASDEVVAKETSDVKITDADPMEEDLNTNSEVTSENTNAEVSHPDPEATRASIDTVRKAERASKVEKVSDATILSKGRYY